MGCKRDKFADTEAVAKVATSGLPGKWDLTGIEDTSHVSLHGSWAKFIRLSCKGEKRVRDSSNLVFV